VLSDLLPRLKIADTSNQNVNGFSGFDFVRRCDWWMSHSILYDTVRAFDKGMAETK